MKKILASIAFSVLAALPALQAQTIQELNQHKDTQADIEAQIEEQKHQHYSTGNTKDKQIFNHLSIGATAGLDAFGLEVAAPVTPFLQLRGGYSFMPRISTNATYNTQEETFKLSDNRTVTIPANHKFPLTVDVTSGGPHLMLDIFPSRTTKFHFSVGAYYRHDSQFVNAKLDVSDILDKTEYGGGAYYQLDADNRETRISADPDGCLHLGIFSGSPIRPYAGLGFGRSVDPEGRISVVFDMGVLFWGHPQICSVYYGMADPDSPLYRKDKAGNPYMMVPIKSEDIKKLPVDDTQTVNMVANYLDTFNDLLVFPMMKLGLFVRIF